MTVTAADIRMQLDLWPRQRLAVKSEANEILFGGATEGGKSHLVRVLLIALCTSVPELQCVLIRKKYDDIIKNHVEGPTGFRVLLSDLVTKKLAKITRDGIRFLWNNALISFQHCQDERQFNSAQGVEKHVLVIDEATQISERLIRFFRGWVRMPEAFKEKVPKVWRFKLPLILYTANPIGVSVSYFKRHFVKARPEFAIEKVHGFRRQYIPSKAKDNKAIDMEAHEGRLAGFDDPAMRKALRDGDWDAPVGDFFPEYDEDRHVIPDMEPPAHWFRYRSFDWGTAEPFAVYWLAVSDGESFIDTYVDTDGATKQRKRWYPRGALIVYREWYGCAPDRPAEGLRMRNEDMAYGILARSLHPSEKNLSTVTDSLPFQDRGGVTIAETFRNCGVPLTLGDTSRPPGWSQLRSRLIGKKIDSNDTALTPMIFITESCRYLRDYLPALPRHHLEHKREDAAEHGEATHAPDAIRLACMARVFAKDADPPPFETKNIKAEMTVEQALKMIQRNKARANGVRW